MVTDCGKDDYTEENVMHRSGSGWKWLMNPDNILYDNIRTFLDIHPPKAAGNRRQFVFDDIV